MILTVGIILAALVLGAILPLRWGALGFLGAVAGLFIVQMLISAAGGYAGSPLSESLLLFGGSWLSYLGFNAQITYRAFMVPVVVLASVLIWRHRRSPG